MPIALLSKFKPRITSTVAYSQRVRRVQFGDGYMERSPDGINTASEKWQLVFFCETDADARELVAFLNARSTDAVIWTPTGESAAKLYLVSAVQRKFVAGTLAGEVTCTFEQAIA